MMRRWQLGSNLTRRWSTGGRGLLATLLALVLGWSGAQAGPGQTAPTITLNKTRAVFGERLTATISNGSCKSGTDTGRDKGVLYWYWPNGESSTLLLPGVQGPGAVYQFETPPLAAGPVRFTYEFACPSTENSYVLYTFTPSITVDTLQSTDTTRNWEANEPVKVTILNTTKDVVYTRDWGEGVDTWVGDGSPTHMFEHTYRLTTPGSFPYGASVSSKFTFSDGSKSHTESDPGYPTNYLIYLPTIKLNSPTTTAAFTDVSVSYDSLVVGRTYTVNWGDGTVQPVVGTAGQLTVTHQYKKDGLYAITTLGSVNLAKAAPPSVTVQSPPPTLTVTGAGLKAAVSFVGLQGDTDYTLDWGDGQTSPLARNAPAQGLSHDYAAPGNFTIKLYGPTGGGTTGVLSTATFTATIGNVTLLLTPDRPVIDAQVVLTLSGLAESATYTLDWGDGTTESGITGQTTATRTHAYKAAQDYTVTVQNGGKTLGTATASVQLPTPALVPAVQGLTLTLQVQNLVAGAAYTVNWGEGAPEALTPTGPAATLRHSYARPGSYTVSVTPARGTAASAPVTVVASQPRLTVTPPVVDTDQTVTAAMADLLTVLEYTLDWRDGSPPVRFTPSDVQATQTHSYAAPGTYQVQLTAPNLNPTTAPVSVRPGAPTLSLSADALTVRLSASRLLTGVSYTLDWGGGVTERFTASGPAQSFTHVYTASGPQTVTVTPDGGTPATASVSLSVPVPTLNVTPAQGQTGTAFTATLAGLVPSLGYTLAWGDGVAEAVTGAATFSRDHQYALPGTFSVSVASPGAPPVQRTVTVRVPAPLLTATNLNLALTLQLSRLVRTTAYRVQWGDGQEQTLTAQTPDASLTHTYAAAGTYTVTVTPEQGDAASVTVNVQYVSVDAPTLKVTPASAPVYAEVRADFSGLIASLSYTLDWGDGQREVISGVSSGQKVHSYTTAGTYTVSLKAPQSPAATGTVVIIQPVPVLSVTTAGLDAQLTVGTLVPALTYRLEWGDGTPAVDLTGAPSKTLTHSYARPGPYLVTLTVPNAPAVTAPVNVTVPPAALIATTDALTATATLSGLQPRLTYTLTWGDGSSSTLSGVAADTRTHSYARPGSYTLTLSTPGTADVSATVNLQVRALTLQVVSPALSATAALSGLIPALTYTLDWGDGQQTTLTGQAATTLQHSYRVPGQYTVTAAAPGLEPVTATVVAGLPPQEVISAAPLNSPDVQDIRISGLITGGIYLLDYGDGQTEPLSFTGSSGRWTHRYARSGVYTLILTLRTPDGVSGVRAVSTVQAQPPLVLSAATLAFQGAAGAVLPLNSLTLTSLDPVAVRLSVPYTGSGSLSGSWILDGQAGPAVTLDLPEGVGDAAATATYTVSPPRPGRHTLSFQITGAAPRCAAGCASPALPAANTLSYTLDVPTTLAYGGLTVKLTSVTNLNLQSFAGTGTLRLVVGGADLGPQNVTLSGLQVTRTGVGDTAVGDTAAGYKVTGGAPTRVDLGSLQLRVLSLGLADVRLQTLTLKPDGAALSGTVQLPGDSTASLAFQDARLQPGGELYAELSGAGSGLSGAAIGTTGVSVSASGGILDLSSTQNADALKTAYARSQAGVPGPDWMGVVLPGARLSVAAPLLSGTPTEIGGPVAYTLGGYTTAFDLNAALLPVGGWSVQTQGLQVAVSGSVIASVSGKASLKVPMVNETLPLNLGWNTQLGTPGAKWTISAAVAPAVHDFGRTKLDLGSPTWETSGDGSAKLIFSNAKWNLGGVSGAEVKLPLYNLTFTPDGGVSLGGEAWASATGLTNFTLFQYPFPAADVGVAFQGDGQYTLSLRGKLQLTEAVPLSGTVEPVNFWVKNGKDLKIVFEKLQVKGEVKTVSFDISVSAQFQDENNLEFIGEGDLTIAKKLSVGVKAGFGRDNGTGYGFLWARYRAPDTSVKPLATVGAFGFYEFNGGLAINMGWKDGNFDVPPVKAIPKSGVTTVAVQAGTVFGPWADKGSTAHFRGTLGIDTAGTIAISAKAWFLTPLDEGAFGTETPNAAALVVLNVPPENPSAGYFLAQACVGPAATTVRGLDCSKNRELSFAGIIALRGYAEVYTPFSGDGQHVYIGTKQSPISVRLLIPGLSTPGTPAAPPPPATTPAPAAAGTAATPASQPKKENGLEINGYLMLDSTSVRAGLGANYRYSIGDKGEGTVCDWHWEAAAWVAVNADFAVIYNPTALDASVSLSAGASAGAGACGVDVTVGVNLALTGRLYISAAQRYFAGNFKGEVIMPVIPDIKFSINGRADF